MRTSDRAKELGAKNLASVARFYGFSTQYLRTIHSNNEDAFKAMVLGYLAVIGERKSKEIIFKLDKALRGE